MASSNTAKEAVIRSEDSVPMRVVHCSMIIVAIVGGLLFGQSASPLAEINLLKAALMWLAIWLCVGGSLLSYYFRKDTPMILTVAVKLAAALIVLNLVRELWLGNLHAQHYQFIPALVDALVCIGVMSCFELRTRSEIMGSSVFGLSLMAVAACSGRSVVFGAFVFLYLVLGGALAFFSAQSQTLESAGDKSRASVVSSKGKERLPCVLSVSLLPLIAIVVFSFVPRLDREAEDLTFRAMSAISNLLYRAQNPQAQPDPRRIVQLPPHKAGRATVPRESAVHNPAKSKSKKKDSSTPSKNKSTPDGAKTEPKPDAKKLDAKKADPKKTEEPPTPAATTATEDAEGQKKSDNNASEIDPSAQYQNQAKSTASPAEPANNPIKTTASAGKPKSSSKSKSKPQNKPTDLENFSLGSSVKRGDDVLFTVACNRSLYIKMVTYDFFDGRAWSRHDTGNPWNYGPTEAGVDLSPCPVLKHSLALPVMELSQDITVKSELSPFIPVGGIPQRLSLLKYIFVDSYGNVSIDRNLQPKDKYTAICDYPVCSQNEMRKAASLPDTDRSQHLAVYVQLPDDQSEQTFELARKLTAGKGNRFCQAEAIASYLRQNFRYAQTPIDGDAQNLVDEFLFKKKQGDCKAFATALVVLLRAVDVPARVVGGFLPGDLDAMTGQTEVKLRHGHAWAEVYMEPYGWVSFDPTPGGLLPARPEQQYYNFETLKRQLSEAGDMGAKIVFNLEKALEFFGYALGVAAINLSMIVVVASIIIVRKIALERWQHFKKRHPATKVRDRVLKQLQKVGVRREPSDTGKDVVARLEKALQETKVPVGKRELQQNVVDFFDTYNAAYYGKQDQMVVLTALAEKIQNQLTSK